MANPQDKNNTTDIDKSDVFNTYLNNFLLKNKWIDENSRKEFIALVNTIITNTQSNSNFQKRMLVFLNQAVKTLNLELQKLKITTDEEIDQIDADEINIKEDNSDKKKKVQVESLSQFFTPVNRGEGNNSGTENVNSSETNLNDNKDLIEKIRELKTNFKKELSDNGVDNKKVSKIMKLVFKFDDVKNTDRKLLLDKCVARMEESMNKIKSSTPHKIVEGEEKDEEKKEDDKVSPKNVEPKNANSNDVQTPKNVQSSTTDNSDKSNISSTPKDIKKKPSPTEKPKKTKEDKPSEEEKLDKSAYTNNFKVFLKTYCLDERGWVLDDYESISQILQNLATKTEQQTEIVLNLGKIIKEIESFKPEELVVTDNSKNYLYAMSNLKKIMELYNNWSSSNSSAFLNSIKTIFGYAKDVKTQKIILNKLGGLTSKLKEQ